MAIGIYTKKALKEKALKERDKILEKCREKLSKESSYQKLLKVGKPLSKWQNAGLDFYLPGYSRKGINIMDETLKGAYKELWIEYQNSETAAVQDLTYDQLIERIAKWEEIEFEARAKRQKSLAEKRSRDEAKKKAERDALISDPHYVSAKVDVPKPYKVKATATGPKLTKQDKLRNTLADLGVDLGDLLGDIQKKADAKKDSNGENGEVK